MIEHIIYFLIVLVVAVIVTVLVCRAKAAARQAADDEKLRAISDAHERFKNEFNALAAEALRNNNETFLALAKQNFDTLRQGAAGDLEKRQQAIDSLVKPLKESLEKVDGKLGELDQVRAKTQGQLAEQLKQLAESQARLQGETTRLSTALRSTTYVGSWGELQLRRVVEMADMLPYCDFVEQQSATGADSRLRADVVVKLPAGQQIVIDSKAPIQDYRAAAEAADEEARRRHLVAHAAKIREHAKALGAKNYWEQFQPGPEFVILFIPGDHFLTAALQADGDLLQFALERKVLLATPTTLIALLKAVAYGWRQAELSESARKVGELGRELYERICKFADNLDGIGGALKSAVNKYNATVGNFERTLLPGARKFTELKIEDEKSLPEVKAVEEGPRDLMKRE